MSEKDESIKLRKSDKKKIVTLLEKNTCINCGEEIDNKPQSVFSLAPGPEMVVIRCQKCNRGNYKIIKKTLDELEIEYDIEDI